MVTQAAKRLTVGLASCVLLAALLFGGAKVLRVMGQIGRLRSSLERLEARTQGDPLSSLKRTELGRTRAELAQVGDDLEALQAELGPILILAPHLGWMPGVGGDVVAAPDLLEVGVGIAAIGDLVLEGLDPLVAALESSGDPSSDVSTGERLAAALLDGGPQFAAAQGGLGEVRQRRERINDGLLSPRVGALLERLDRYLPLLDTGLQVLAITPRLLGAEEPRTYLLLAQNENELRATGGFISSVALLRLSGGRIEELEFRDSYDVDDLSRPHPSPPQPLEMYMQAQIWLVRDANWSPDFPTSARVARELYDLDQGVLVDGVIAADQTALQSLLGPLGPVRLEEYGVWVNGDNFLELMRRYWSSPQGEGQSGDWWVHRKDFMGELLAAMLAKVESDAASLNLPEVIKVLGRALEEKHVLVYLEDAVIGGVLAANRWDGALPSPPGDFLMVVDTNMGYNKVNPSIESSLDYQVLINEDGSLQAELSVRQRNKSITAVSRCVQETGYEPTYGEMMEGCYWNYLRVYAPEKAQLLEGPERTLPEGSLRARDGELGGAPLPPEVGRAEAGKTVFATFFVVPPREGTELVFRYQLPSEVLERESAVVRYRLLVPKQPGTLGIPLHVAVTLPAGSEVVATRPEASSSTEGTVEFRTNLLVDREFEVVFR